MKSPISSPDLSFPPQSAPLPPSVSVSTPRRGLSGWRQIAARLAAELLCQVSPAAADEVLDLRSALLDFQTTAGGLLKAFFAARNRLESEHYLLFFRLRGVMEPALGLEISGPGLPASVRPVDFRHRDPARLARRIRQECWERCPALPSPESVTVRPVWRLAPVSA